MNSWHQARKFRLAVIVMMDLLIALHSALAQQTPSPKLDEILLRLENNLRHYEAQVPDLFCKEHVVSSMAYGQKHQDTVTDSVFRLKRVPNPHQATTLVESREIKAINGTPAEGERINGPSILSGVFSGGLDIVSLNQKICMRYTLAPINPEHSGDPYVIDFATLARNHPPSGCILKEDGTGRIFIDPATMQVTRMELTVPNHTIIPAVVGTWKISIDYAPIPLGGQTFWMPRTITSTATPNEDVDDPTVWSFRARYADYHKLEVTSRILPFGNSTAQ